MVFYFNYELWKGMWNGRIVEMKIEEFKIINLRILYIIYLRCMINYFKI